MHDNDGCGVALLALLIIPILVIVSSIANGFVLTVLWGWFIVPIFTAPSLGIVQAIGFSLVISFLTHQRQETSKNKKSMAERVIESLIYIILYPAFVLAVGWMVHLFI